MAAVNSLGKAGGSLGPLSMGLLAHSTHSYVAGVLLVAAALVAGGCMALAYWGDDTRARYQRLGGRGVHADAAAVEMAIAGGGDMGSSGLQQDWPAPPRGRLRSRSQSPVHRAGGGHPVCDP